MTPQEITSVFANVSADQMQKVIKHISKQEATQAALQGKNNEEIVKYYLDFMAKRKPELAAKYPNNAASKTIKDCMSYIMDQASKLKKGNCAMVISDQVFEWAEDYFIKDDIKKIEKKTSTTTPTYQPKQKSSKEKIKELQDEKTKWEADNSKLVQEWEIANNAKIDKFEQEHALDLFKPENPYTKSENPYLGKTFPKQEELDKLLLEEKNAPTAQNESPSTDVPDQPEPSDEEETDDPDDDTSEDESSQEDDVQEQQIQPLSTQSVNSELDY